MGEQPGYIPPEAQKSIARRDHLGPRLMREVTRGPSDEFLEKRAEWMIGNSKIGEYLRPKIVFEDRLAGKVEKGVSVLAVGAGKGHEIDEMDSILPGSKITGLDPHDFYAPPVEKRIRELSHNAKYLGADSRAEQIAGIHDQSQDGVTLFFTLHHTDQNDLPKIFSEVNRVLKDDGYVFIAEDLVDSAAEEQTAEHMDRIMNIELSKNSPHNYQSMESLKKTFSEHGFDVVEANEVKPGKVKHGFFVLKKQAVHQ
jgi:ubiquinone/menaquinone biosynthesis C-methylase UbiE